MKKIICALMCVLSFSAGAFAKGQGAEKSGFKVGYVCNNFNDTFQLYVMEAAQKQFESVQDIEFVTQDAQEDVIRQQDVVNILIAQGVDALIVVPVDTSAMAPITKAAAEAGIPVCYVNRNPYAGKTMPQGVYYVGSKEIIAGKLQMEYMGELLNGKGGIAVLMGKLDNEGALKRTEGVENTVADEFPNIKVLATETGNWQRDQGMALTENWLTAYGAQLNGIISNNDEMALGAVEALKAAGRTDIPVIGLDAITDAKVAIENGSLSATVLQDSVGQGGGAAKIIERVLRGETPEQVNWVPFVLITPENLAEYK